MINKKRIVNFNSNKLVNSNNDIILDTSIDDNLLVSSNTHITENININVDNNILVNNTPKVFPIKPSNVNSGHYLKVNSTGTDLEFDNLSNHLIQTKFTHYKKSFSGNNQALSSNELPLPFSVTIKPNSINSKILISTAVNYSSTGNGRFFKFLLYRSDDNGITYNVINESMNDHHSFFKKSFMTSNWGGDADNYHIYQLSNNVNEYLDIANTTNPISYKLYCHSESGNIDNTRTFTINVPYNTGDSYRPEPTSYIMAQEIFYPNPMTYIRNSINYRTYTFTESSTFTLDKAAYCDYLIVAGGGAAAGRGNEGGGGGAGGVVYRENVLFNNGTYNIIIGSGGTATDSTTATSGGNSIISNLSSNNQARGGGSGDINGTGGGFDGGSGGGGCHHGTTNTNRSNGLKIDGSTPDTSNNVVNQIGEFGNDGGCKNFFSNSTQIDNGVVGGGGGGSGEIGYDGNGTNHSTNSTNTGAGSEELRGKGGDGKIYNIRDGITEIYYGGGGGGSRYYGGGAGGKGGGGHGANPENNEARKGVFATRNSGGGGGGGCNDSGGNGGSGLIIIAVRE